MHTWHTGEQARNHNHDRTRSKRTDQKKEISMHYMGGSTFRRRSKKAEREDIDHADTTYPPARTPPHDISTRHSKQREEKQKKQEVAMRQQGQTMTEDTRNKNKIQTINQAMEKKDWWGGIGTELHKYTSQPLKHSRQHINKTTTKTKQADTTDAGTNPTPR